jgi:hypothetical protein
MALQCVLQLGDSISFPTKMFERGCSSAESPAANFRRGKHRMIQTLCTSSCCCWRLFR